MPEQTEAVFAERTLVLIKPDGVERGLVGEILGRFERAGFKIAAMKMLEATTEDLREHFPESYKWIERIGERCIKGCLEVGINAMQVFDMLGIRGELSVAYEDFYGEIGGVILEWNIQYLTSGPVVVAILKGSCAISAVRKMIGDTVPLDAALGTIRGDFSFDSVAVALHGRRALRNIIHASADAKEAEQEIKCWFGDLAEVREE